MLQPMLLIFSHPPPVCRVLWGGYDGHEHPQPHDYLHRAHDSGYGKIECLYVCVKRCSFELSLLLIIQIVHTMLCPVDHHAKEMILCLKLDSPLHILAAHWYSY